MSKKLSLDTALVLLQEEKSKVDLEEAKLGEGLKNEKEALIAIIVELYSGYRKIKNTPREVPYFERRLANGRVLSKGEGPLIKI